MADVTSSNFNNFASALGAKKDEAINALYAALDNTDLSPGQMAKASMQAQFALSNVEAVQNTITNTAKKAEQYGR
jgi:hypothetical protein